MSTMSTCGHSSPAMSSRSTWPSPKSVDEYTASFRKRQGLFGRRYLAPLLLEAKARMQLVAQSEEADLKALLLL